MTGFFQSASLNKYSGHVSERLVNSSRHKQVSVMNGETTVKIIDF